MWPVWKAECKEHSHIACMWSMQSSETLLASWRNKSSGNYSRKQEENPPPDNCWLCVVDWSLLWWSILVTAWSFLSATEPLAHHHQALPTYSSLGLCWVSPAAFQATISCYVMFLMNWRIFIFHMSQLDDNFIYFGYFFPQSWGLNSGPCDCQSMALPLS